MYIFTEEHRRKISESVKKLWQNPIYRKRNLESKGDFSLFMKKLWKNDEFRNKNRGFEGHKLSKEHKNKISLACKGKHPTEKTREKMSLFGKTRVGNKNSFFGKLHSEKSKEKMKISAVKKWKNAIYREKQIKLLMKRRLCKRPTEPERILIGLIEKNNLPFDYVGNGKIIIERFNPDFIDNDGSKQIIEVFGEHWHRLSHSKKRDEKRLKSYKKYGYKTLIIWENELTKNFDENKIVEKIRNFII